jgi:hypothetical protein
VGVPTDQLARRQVGRRGSPRWRFAESVEDLVAARPCRRLAREEIHAAIDEARRGCRRQLADRTGREAALAGQHVEPRAGEWAPASEGLV